MRTTQFIVETAQREPANKLEAHSNKLEAHLLEVAGHWCQAGAVIPINTLYDFQKRLEQEAAWYCYDHKKANPRSVIIGVYDEDMIYIRPVNRPEATATIRLEEVSQPVEYCENGYTLS